ncbi:MULTISPECIES: CDF family Co(II)/Ni(II) efflux transporter DmeF [Pandoraea]|uniref:Cation transporter n=2 Tax=Pandoraea TaxID=93217 RepID=A0A5E5PFA7_9BURK|nr:MULTISPECIES: CDF family Co(II)/Ni(II) efflux transporter DmeF [Pandoraea]MBN9094666.1 CDF family Co(II)/Ni(II) efflux transporter DmeF [Pandoraea pnomenusa]OXS88451.1 cation transporter [Pandoraea apista]RRJ28855.1 cation transporter [Pandoraea apista]RRJ73783.1 cation transporter [Pandoraea apista]RSD07661.1 cation transporter [Pandoraea apista]
MSNFEDSAFDAGHDHIYLGAAHRDNERRTWMVIALCSAMMVAEIIGGSLYGSLALVADGLHMSTHAGAMLIAALAYTYARRHATDSRFVFGTGKLGDLAGFTSAIVLAMIAILIAYEAVARFISPVPIHFDQAIPIAILGLLVNLASVWLLSGDHHGHSHSHAHEHGHDHGLEQGHGDEPKYVRSGTTEFVVTIFEDGVPPVWRITPTAGSTPLSAEAVSVSTMRPDGKSQTFGFVERNGYLESTHSIPEPHAFQAVIHLPDGEHRVEFEEHAHPLDDSRAAAHRDHNIRSAYVHVIADAAVSVLAIIGLLLARAFGWLWMDPLAGVIGALVIANWSWGLMRDTGAILLDMNPDSRLRGEVRRLLETSGDKVVDLHVWRLGPGHMGAIVSIVTRRAERTPTYYHATLKHLRELSHLTVEVHVPRVVS